MQPKMSLYYILSLFCEENCCQSTGFPGRHIGSATGQIFIPLLKSKRTSRDRFTPRLGNSPDRFFFNYILAKNDINRSRAHGKCLTRGVYKKNCKNTRENTYLHNFVCNSYLLTPTPFLFLGLDDISKIIFCVIFSAPILILALSFFIYGLSGRFNLRFFLLGIIHMILIHFLVTYFLF